MAADTLTRTKGLHPLLLGWHTGGPLSALSLTGREEAPVCRHNSGNGNDVGPSSRDDMRQAFCCAFFHNGTPLTSHFLGCHRGTNEAVAQLGSRGTSIRGLLRDGGEPRGAESAICRSAFATQDRSRWDMLCRIGCECKFFWGRGVE